MFQLVIRGDHMASGFKPKPGVFKEIQRTLEREARKHPVRIPIQAEAAGTGAVSGGGGGRGGVTGSEFDLVAGFFLDWLFVLQKSQRGAWPSISQLVESTGNQEFLPMVEAQGDVAVDALVQDDLVKEAKAMGRFGMLRRISLTDAGNREAAQRIERRRDNRARRNACRDAVLRWVYERDANGESTEIAEIVTSPYGWFSGELYSGADLAGAVQFLRERRLLGGTDEIPTIEPAGTECIEQYGGVVDYLNRGDGAGVNVTILGDNKGQLAVANRDVAQTQTNTNEGQVLAIFAEALREFARLLPEDQQPRYEMVASELEQEAAKEQPDKTWVRSLLDRGKGLLEGAPANLQHLAQVAKIGFDLYGQGLS
ncbi:hypothetical protein [Micromonospora humi]|uniref:Uncharacterized protein n=1 Tax=Micromonospora humi TaxID=745366 RepID=A0A1C5HLQ7_9ACTN|nr:hypothetical protein [Micromonospora humi]SCG46925.1 hypothetical protein GA0070213_103294 [Micromonospora humi]